RFSLDAQRQWREKGYLEINDDGPENAIRLSVRALDALEKNLDRLDVSRAMQRLSTPILLLHGREDRVVTLSEGQRLWQRADHQLSRLHVIEDCGHTFRTQHPFAGPSRALAEAVDATIAWFQKNVR